jgi:hypothetical protein
MNMHGGHPKWRFLYIPEQGITISLNPEIGTEIGKLTRRSPFDSRFCKDSHFKEILEKGESDRDTEYIGKIDIPKNLYEEITSLTNEYKHLEKSALKLGEKEDQTIGNIEKIFKNLEKSALKLGEKEDQTIGNIEKILKEKF